jgi:hypothetical protein
LRSPQQNRNHQRIDHEQLDLGEQLNGRGARNTHDNTAERRAADAAQPADTDDRKCKHDDGHPHAWLD